MVGAAGQQSAHTTPQCCIYDSRRQESSIHRKQGDLVTAAEQLLTNKFLLAMYRRKRQCKCVPKLPQVLSRGPVTCLGLELCLSTCDVKCKLTRQTHTIQRLAGISATCRLSPFHFHILQQILKEREKVNKC